jgi:ATP-dependent Clp protease ATP-binding subunit ClpC
MFSIFYFRCWMTASSQMALEVGWISEILFIIMTSNIGVRDLKDFGAGIGFSTKSKQDSGDDFMRSTIQNALKKVFSPEFLNRLDDVIIFNSLQKEHIQILTAFFMSKI